MTDVFSRHQIAIAKRTMELSEAGAMILGGMTHKEAVAVLRANGWNDRRIAGLYYGGKGCTIPDNFTLPG